RSSALGHGTTATRDRSAPTPPPLRTAAAVVPVNWRPPRRTTVPTASSPPARRANTSWRARTHPAVPSPAPPPTDVPAPAVPSRARRAAAVAPDTAPPPADPPGTGRLGYPITRSTKAPRSPADARPTEPTHAPWSCVPTVLRATATTAVTHRSPPRTRRR